MKKYLILFLKGMGMGAANVIPGVSGGTIALITEIYEDLINSLKSFDKQAIKYLLSFNIEQFIQHTNLYFLTAVFSGSIASVFSVAILFKYLFRDTDEMSASVKIKENMVPKFGAIIPEPFAIPAILIFFSPTLISV